MEQFRGEVARDPVIVIRELEVMGVTQTSANDAQILEARKVGKEKYLDMALILAADNSRYSRLMNDLVNQFTMGHNNYPVNITSAYNIIINYCVTTQSTYLIINDSEAVAFATVEVTKRNKTCRRSDASDARKKSTLQVDAPTTRPTRRQMALKLPRRHYSS
jgi:hypothetical protein